MAGLVDLPHLGDARNCVGDAFPIRSAGQAVGLLVTPFLQPVLYPSEEPVSLAEFFDGLVRQHPAAA